VGLPPVALELLDRHAGLAVDAIDQLNHVASIADGVATFSYFVGTKL
jgi:hypothetical protein